jgi:hypothetical protein
MIGIGGIAAAIKAIVYLVIVGVIAGGLWYVTRSQSRLSHI